MQSAYHNPPTGNGVQEKEGQESAARVVSRRIQNRVAEFSPDLTGAYPRDDGLGQVTAFARCRRHALVPA